MGRKILRAQCRNRTHNLQNKETSPVTSSPHAIETAARLGIVSFNVGVSGELATHLKWTDAEFNICLNLEPRRGAGLCVMVYMLSMFGHRGKHINHNWTNTFIVSNAGTALTTFRLRHHHQQPFPQHVCVTRTRLGDTGELTTHLKWTVVEFKTCVVYIPGGAQGNHVDIPVLACL